MKKFVRFLLVALALIVVLMFALALYEPTDIKVSRSTLIKAPKEAVFDQMVHFKNWTNWSPWYLMDTTMKLTYTGIDGQTGSAYQWVGEKNKTGAGEMKNTGVEGTSMNFDVHFTEPREGKATGLLSAKDSAGMTKATWTFTMHVSFPFNAMMAFMNMDKMLGGDFETGLANMKKYVESHNAVPEVKIMETLYTTKIFEGVRQTVKMDAVGKFFADTYGLLEKEIKDKRQGPRAGIFYNWDMATGTTDLMAAYAVTDSAAKVAGGTFVVVPSCKAYMAVETGGYSASFKYHSALAKYVHDKGLKETMVIEEYLSGPVNEPDSNKWVTNIYYLVP